MLGRKERDQLELFITGSLRQLVPDDHILARVDRVLDLSWLRDEVADLYCVDNGRPGIDPEAAVRLMLAGFLLGRVHDRRLMREAQVKAFAFAHATGEWQAKHRPSRRAEGWPAPPSFARRMVQLSMVACAAAEPVRPSWFRTAACGPGALA